jgi:hypothetical protein
MQHRREGLSNATGPTTHHKAGATRGTKGLSCVEVGEEGAIAGESIKVGRSSVGPSQSEVAIGTIRANVPPSPVCNQPRT